MANVSFNLPLLLTNQELKTAYNVWVNKYKVEIKESSVPVRPLGWYTQC